MPVAVNGKVEVRETTAANVTVRHVSSCVATSCESFAEDPERLTLENATPTNWLTYIVVTEASGNLDANINVTFTEK